MKELRKTCPKLVVIALSGRLEAKRAAAALGADAFVSKSNPPEHVLAAIASCECQDQSDSPTTQDSKKRTVSPPQA